MTQDNQRIVKLCIIIDNIINTIVQIPNSIYWLVSTGVSLVGVTVKHVWSQLEYRYHR